MKQSAAVAIEKTVKARFTKEGGQLHRTAQNAALFGGHRRTWAPLDDDGERFPDDSKRVQLRYQDVLESFRTLATEYWDITLTKDHGNRQAVADVIVDGVKLATSVPATTLIFMEKQLEHVRTFIEKLPVLDDSEVWAPDSNTGLFHTPELSTHKTKKIQKPIVLYPATEQHPAQTQLVPEDVLIGHWNTTKFSGAMPSAQQQQILSRITKLQKAVKRARVDANSTDIDRHEIGDDVFNYLFS